MSVTALALIGNALVVIFNATIRRVCQNAFVEIHQELLGLMLRP